MLSSLLYLIPVIPAAAMIMSDFRKREINVLWLLVFATTMAVIAVVKNGISTALWNMLINTSLLLYLFLGTTIYLLVKFRRWTNLLKNHIGGGDIFFILTLTPFLEFRSFVVFLVLSMLLSLVWWVCTYLLQRTSATIPLVGTIGIALCGLLIYKTIMP